MAIPSKQIGWSEKSNLLWEVSRQLDRLLNVIGGQGSTVTTTSSTTTISSTTTTTTTTGCLNCTQQDLPPIGTQIWQKCNLNVDTYSDGETIPEVQDQAIWDTLTIGAWCYYDNDPANGAIYGKLYNWYAVMGIYDAASLANPLLRKKLGPVGYRVPSKTDFETLFNVADPASGGGTDVPNTAGSALKEAGNCRWAAPFNTDATNSTGFTALPGGVRFAGSGDLEFDSITGLGAFLNTTEIDLTGDIEFAYMGSGDGTAAFAVGVTEAKKIGASVRLIKD
jgi:uncharacterized protein (TIGR02145 family)